MVSMIESISGSTKLLLNSDSLVHGDPGWLSSLVWGSTVNGTCGASRWMRFTDSLVTASLSTASNLLESRSRFSSRLRGNDSSVDEKSNLRYSWFKTAGNLRFGKILGTRELLRKSMVCSTKVCFSSGNSNRCDLACLLELSF